MKDLLRIADLTAGDLAHLLATAERIKREPLADHELLCGRTVLTYFAKPSTRTRLSFAAAVARLGGTPEVVGPAELQLGRGETIEDTAMVVSRYASAFVIRTYADDDVRRFAAAATIPVVNALTDGHHPCQALADLLTLQERFGSLRGLRVAYLGAGNNVAHSLMEGCALAGADITVATPKAYRPDTEVVDRARELASVSGSEITLTDDPRQASAGADAVYTDVWLSMGDSEDERSRRLAALRPFQIDEATMARAADGAIFMHCLPAHRGEEVAAAVMDGPRSAVFDQAENRMHTAQALLVALLDRQLHGATDLAGAR